MQDAGSLRQRLDSLASDGTGHGRRDALRFSLRSGAQAALDRLPRAGGNSRPELLRPARVGGPAREFRRNRKRRPARAPLVSPRTRGDPGRARCRPRLVVGIDVRVPDAVARHARSSRQPAGRDEPADRSAPEGLRTLAQRAVGNLGVRLQRARSRAHVPVLQLRSSRARTEAWTRRRHRHCALCDRARRDGRAACRDAQLRQAGWHCGPGSLRLLRGAGLHAAAPACRAGIRNRSRVHGASPGHDHRRARQHAAEWPDAQAFPRRAADPGDGAAAAGTNSPRCRGGARDDRGERPEGRRQRADVGSCHGHWRLPTTPRRAPTCCRMAATP